MKQVLLLLILMCSISTAKMLKVVVLDTGIREDVFNSYNHFCRDGHLDVTGSNSIRDHLGHGTFISGTIDAYSGGCKTYCQVVVKYFIPSSSTNASRLIAGIHHAISIKADIINISGGGSDHIFEETLAIMRALNAGITIVAAAGNNGEKLEPNGMPGYFPAMCDERVIVVGNGSSEKARRATSNYGQPIDVWEDITGLKMTYGYRPSGTSAAAAKHTGKLVRKLCTK